jgi:AraC-like DNA-binding protein
MASEAWQEDADAPQLGARARSELDRCSAVEKVIAAMHERIDRPFSLDEMARIAYLSRFYFNRVFREATGLPPVRFHTALRIAAAKRLLLTTGLSVTEVCLEVGYQSLGTFTTHFHELVGLSPRELRRSSAETAAAAMARFASGHDATGAPAVEGEILGAGEAGRFSWGCSRSNTRRGCQPRTRRSPAPLPTSCALLRMARTM